MSEFNCMYAYPDEGDLGVRSAPTLLCEQPARGQFNWPVGAEDAIQVPVCDLHAAMLTEALHAGQHGRGAA